MLTGLMTVLVGSLALAAPSNSQAATAAQVVDAGVVDAADEQPSVAVQMIPTPGAAGLIALGGVALLRRKRDAK